MLLGASLSQLVLKHELVLHALIMATTHMYIVYASRQYCFPVSGVVAFSERNVFYRFPLRENALLVALTRVRVRDAIKYTGGGLARARRGFS